MQEKITRRTLSSMLGAFGIASAHAQIKPGTSIHQEVDFKTTPARIYQALLDPKQFSAFTKDAAEIQPQPGGTFKLFGARIEGRNIELMLNARIVQAWRPAYWPPGVYSIVHFELAANDSGTHLVFDHTGFTEDKWEDLNIGWPRMYWEPLRKYLNA